MMWSISLPSMTSMFSLKTAQYEAAGQSCCTDRFPIRRLRQIWWHTGQEKPNPGVELILVRFSQWSISRVSSIDNCANPICPDGKSETRLRCRTHRPLDITTSTVDAIPRHLQALCANVSVKRWSHAIMHHQQTNILASFQESIHQFGFRSMSSRD